jgi:hypothetical protein
MLIFLTWFVGALSGIAVNLHETIVALVCLVPAKPSEGGGMLDHLAVYRSARNGPVTAPLALPPVEGSLDLPSEDEQDASLSPAGALTRAPGPLAGWLLDPEEPSLQRWWDGARWTEHRRPQPQNRWG